MRVATFTLGLLGCVACGAELPGNSPYKGPWDIFSVNGAQSLNGFSVDDRGRFDFLKGDVQVSGAITPDGQLAGSARSLSALGSCTLSGQCTSTSACAGSTAGGGCPADSSGRPWVTFAFCRGAGC